jgi:hypothetical protein
MGNAPTVDTLTKRTSSHGDSGKQFIHADRHAPSALLSSMVMFRMCGRTPGFTA